MLEMVGWGQKGVQCIVSPIEGCKCEIRGQKRRSDNVDCVNIEAHFSISHVEILLYHIYVGSVSKYTNASNFLSCAQAYRDCTSG